MFVSPGYSRTGRVWSHERTIHEDRGGFPSGLLCHRPGKVSKRSTHTFNFLSFFPFTSTRPVSVSLSFRFWLAIFNSCQTPSLYSFTSPSVAVRCAKLCLGVLSAVIVNRSHTRCRAVCIWSFLGVFVPSRSVPVCVYAVNKLSFLRLHYGWHRPLRAHSPESMTSISS